VADRLGQQFGNYRLVSLLGQGGYAEVYLGQHVRLSLQAAIKVLHAHLTDQEAGHFQQEAETIAKLTHPSIVHILDFDVQDGVPFLVMEYAPDGSLRRHYPKGHVVPLPEIISPVKQVANALQYAHEQKFIHRDVKPENMLLGRRQEVLLTDFGLAALAHSSASLSTQETIGTLAYMAPEQIEGHPRAASDQYSLGVVVYEWLCGERPFEGSATEVLVQHLSMPPPSLRERMPTIPSEVEQLVLRALAKDPKDRFTSVRDFAEVLEQANQCPPSPTVQQALEQASRSPAASTGYDTVAVTPGEMSAPRTKESAEPPTTVGELERRLVTVLFCDLAQFISQSEQLDPEDMHEILRMYFGRMSKEIKRFGGSIEHYAGDAVLALFGVPVAHEDDAERAVRCGLNMQAAIQEVSAEVGKRWGNELALRVGVNTGEVVSGIWDIGDRKDHAVSGDAVNTAARLQAVAEPGEVLVGEETMWLARKSIRFGERRAATLKGKAGIVPVYVAVEVRQQPRGREERRQHLPLVGRTNELALLSSIWAKVMQEVHPHLVTVLGEPGIGKSRLVAAFEGHLPGEALVLHGRCLPYGEVRGYWALAEVVKEVTGITVADDMEAASRKLGELVAAVVGQTETAWDSGEITHHLALVSGLDLDSDRLAPVADQRTLQVSVCRFIEALARSQPLCILFEDLHWADEALLDLIEFIAARVREAPLLILTQARTELVEQRPTWGKSLRNCTSLALEPLDERHGRELALLLCQERGLAAEVAEQVVRGAAGNPLFAEEMVATIAERGEITGIPSAIKALIAARLDTLPPQERRAIQLAAVIGKVFWEGGLRALGAAGDVTDHLETLGQKELLRSHHRSQMRGDREYAFKHDLVRDVAYETLSRADRRLLHSRLVGWIEVISGERVEEYLDLLAYHAFQAGTWEKALSFAQQAGERAQRLYASRAAIEQFTLALDAARELTLVPPAALYHARGQAYETLGHFEQARHDYEQALEAAHEAHDDVAEWQSLLDLGFLWAERDYQQTGAYFRRAIERARALADPKLLAPSLNRLGNWYLNVEQPQEALRYHQEALATFQALSDRRGKASTLDLLGMASLLGGDLLQSAAYYEQAIALLRELDEREHLPSSLANLMLCGGIYQTETLVPAAVGFAESLKLGELALKIAGEIGQRADEAYTLIHMAMLLGPRGEYARALEVAQRGLAIAEDIEHRQWMTAGHRVLGALYLDLLALPEAQQHLEQALALAQEIGSWFWTRNASALLASVCIGRGDLAQAEALLTAAPASDAPPQTQAQRLIWYARAQLALAQGEPYRTLAITEQLLASTTHVAGEQSIPHLAHLRGKALTTLNRPAEAQTALQAAHTGAMTRGLRPLQWRISIDLGNLYHAQRRDEEAVQAKATAQELIEDLATPITETALRTHFLQQAVLRLDIVDKSTSPLQTHLGPVFGDEAVQRGLLFLE
jgi:serine/threonine protein kinase/predicted ATPase